MSKNWFVDDIHKPLCCHYTIATMIDIVPPVGIEPTS